MKNLSAFFARVATLAILIACTISLAQAQFCNELEDAGFESAATLSNWSAYDGLSPAPSGLTWSQAQPFKGMGAAQLDVTAPGAWFDNRPQPLDLEAGKRYKLSCRMRSTADSAQITGSVSGFSLLEDSTFSVDGFWREYVLWFETTEQNYENLSLMWTAGIAADTNAYSLFFDEISICENDGRDSCNLVSDPGFESINYLQSWSLWDGGSQGSSVLAVSGNDVFEGQRSLRMQVNFYNPNGAYLTSWPSPFTLDSTRYYRLTCRAKSSVDSIRMRMLLVRKTPWALMVDKFVQLDTVWREYSFVFRATDTWTDNTQVQFAALNAWHPGPYEVYLDEIKLCETGISPPEAPGGVREDLKLWLKANDGPDNSPLTIWEDRSGNDNGAVNATSGPEVIPEALNGNAVVQVALAQERIAGAASLSLNSQDHSWYAVLRSENASAGAVALSWGGTTNGYRLEVANNQNWEIENGGSPAASLNVNANDWALLGIHASDSAFQVFQNGSNPLTRGQLSSLSGSQPYVIGAANAIGDQSWQGQVAEIVVFGRSLNTEERHRIESYFAIKYGIPIPELSHRYDSNTGFPNNLAGIGRDEEMQGLRQEKSRSIEAGSVLTISRPSRLGEGDFLVWGHNGASFAANMQVPAGLTERISRVWRISETGSPGKVNVTFDLTGLGLDLSAPYRRVLLIDDDGNFNNARIIADPFVSGESIGFSGVALDDGAYITLGLASSGKPPVAPGRIHEGMALWLTADQGPEVSSAFRWQDRSRMKNPALSADQGPRIHWQEINGNPVVQFDSNDDYMVGAGSLDLPADNHSWYIVARTNQPQNWRNPIVFRENGYRLEVRGGQHTWSVYQSLPNSFNSGIPVDKWHLLSVNSTQANATFYSDGLAEQSRPARTYLLGTGPFILAARNTLGWSSWKGDIAEVIVYTQGHGTPSRQAIETYLSIKYGLPIPVDDHLYYAHKGHPNNLAGIGRDLQEQGLFQSFSQSIDSSAKVQVENHADLDEGEYLVWGHDGATLDLSMQTPSGYPTRLTRTWRISETGDVGLVRVKVDLLGLGVRQDDSSAIALLVDDDGDFSDAVAIPAFSVSGQQAVFQQVNFADGNYFTLAAEKAITSIDDPLSSQALQLTAFPNPVSRQKKLSITYQTEKPEHLYLQVFDMQGKTTWQQQIDHRGGEGSQQIPLAGWGEGIYVIRLSDGIHRASRKVWVR